MISEFLKSNIFAFLISGLVLLLIILYIITIVYISKLNKKYKKLIKKLSNGENIEEVLNNYFNQVEDVQNKNLEIIKYCDKLKNEISICIKKIGMVRYNAFKDTGSDLSFALALLNDNNDGIILNGIYSREMSNIYAKQIRAGKSNNKLSEEEVKALEIAVNS